MIAFRIESVEQVLAEIEPLLRDNWEEIAAYKEKIALAPDYDAYRKLEETGRLLICTARDERSLVGYGIYLVHRGIHYSNNIVATNDVFYVAPAYRRKLVNFGLMSMALLDFAEEKLKARGVSVISLHIKVWKDWSRLAEKQGYQRVEYIHQKYIG